MSIFAKRTHLETGLGAETVQFKAGFGGSLSLRLCGGPDCALREPKLGSK